MSAFVHALSHHARSQPESEAISYGETSISYGELAATVARIATRMNGRVVGLLSNNSPAWIAVDLALQERGACCVPLPPFFSDAQISHVIADAGIDLILTDNPVRVESITGLRSDIRIAALGDVLCGFSLPRSERTQSLAGVAKVTYTSGTTGEPKGVCLRIETIGRVAFSLLEAAGAGERDRALCLLPLSTLLENIGAVYVPLLAGATICMAPAAWTSNALSGRFDPKALLAGLRRLKPTTAILVPQLLQVLVEATAAGEIPGGSFRFIAVGGAPVAERLIESAHRMGLPVFEGYGLSEAASVVCLNHRDAHRPGTVGRPLPHADLRIAEDGEVMVGGALFEGYLHGPARSQPFWPTGDLGHLDKDGYLVLTGRKKTAYATAYGRNLSPEWVERELTLEGAVHQAVVYGEARPFNVALIVPKSGRQHELAAAIARANRRLPGYAQIGHFISIESPFTVGNDLLTGNGRVRREQVWERYRMHLEALYEENMNGVL
jgi:long-subunit acyl-CoA synthetase (AMP-forming)